MAAMFTNPLCQQAYDSTHNLNVEEWYTRRVRNYRTFAKANGLRWTERNFALEVLAHGGPLGRPFDGFALTDAWDHYTFFTKDRRPALFLTEPYDSFDKIDQIAARFGLVVQSPPNPFASFWFPGSTRCITLTRPDFGPVRWTKDQLSFTARRYGELPRVEGMLTEDGY